MKDPRPVTWADICANCKGYFDQEPDPDCPACGVDVSTTPGDMVWAPCECGKRHPCEACDNTGRVLTLLKRDQKIV